jgi:hypothetical protein
MRQNKLHSKFYQANDGYIYFSSFDEGGESEGVNPTWGGNLWRKKPHDINWEHLLATEEALVAVNTNGRFVYALGYWDHVLYQFDTQTEEVNRVVVGSVKEHVSRNFIVDELGHVYVPRLTENDFNEIEAYLIEYDTRLNQIASYPMPEYKSDNMNSHHGIVAYTSMKNGDIFFTSSEGSLFQIKPFIEDHSKLINKGYMHPDGEAYIASLFTIDGIDVLVGVGKKKENKEKRGKKKYEWIVYDASYDLSNAIELPMNYINKPLLYGSLTRDEAGKIYLCGWSKLNNTYQPLFLYLTIN